MYKSIAVLPFENLSSDPENEYFSDGMTEEIINALTQIEHLKVSARTSSFVFKNNKQDIREIGRQLGVSLILEGSVRKSKERLRITAQLIRAQDGFHIWSENFDRRMVDIFDLQDEISLLIADKIREHCGHLIVQDKLITINTHNVKAYQHYLKGRFIYNKWDMKSFAEAADEFKKSIDEDPNFDLPYFGTGLSYSFLGSWGGMNRTHAFELAEAFFSRGLQLDIPSAVSYYTLAKHQFWGLWEHKKAYDSLLQAYTLQPQDSNTNEFMAEIHTLSGNFSTALKYIETSLATDPLSPSHYYTKANIFYLQDRIPEALKVLEKGISIAPSFSINQEFQAICLIQLGIKDAFLSRVNSFEQPIQKAFLMLYSLLQDKSNPSLDKIQELIIAIQQAEHPPLLALDLYLIIHAGYLSEAIQLLTDKVAQKMGHIINFKYDPLLQPLHQLSTFQHLTQQYFSNTPLLIIGSKPQQDKAALSKHEISYYTTILLDLMKKQQYYLKPDLGLKDLAGKIKLHPNKLSWLLNEKIGQNFYEFVNSYRLKDFQIRALQAENQHISILGLAFDSGFNSKSVFNDYFKKKVGTTPKAWIKQQLI